MLAYPSTQQKKGITTDHSSTKFLRYEATDIDERSVLEYQKEINETPGNRTTCLEILQNELKNLKDLEPCLDEKFLLNFLRVSKFDTAKAFQRVLNYYKKFDVLTETYKKISFSLQKAQDLRHICISPYRCENNSFLVLGNCAIDYKKFTFAERFYLEILFVHELMENPINQICGGTYVFDYEGFDIHGYLAYSPGWIRMFLDFLVNIFPCRLKALHIVNAPSLFLPIWKIAYPFLPKKIQTRESGGYLHLRLGYKRECTEKSLYSLG
ncbi:hypothetical protein AVEN_6807-1 [Araneus ventricosus]|uniref:CRAL-TRIO domain-containing protein n=1 Tax=Araneus ventricosus TaxID=182803 RepID=A0A4Y2I794_ARAVE|nr:hypothetical protein AVEN_6807-1 [Araneus ventricosus]